MSNNLFETVTVNEMFAADPRRWLANRMSPGKPWLLAHADDGVIWGRREGDGSLKLSSDVFDDQTCYPALAVELRVVTLQQLRVFGPDGELLVWRTDDGFSARLIEDGQDPHEDTLPDEEHLLWGMGQPPEAPREGFTRLVEGQQGLEHAPPVVVKDRQRPRLVVRHYLGYDNEGQAYVQLSRLVDLEPRQGGQDGSQTH